jgi:hypothetical protein
VLIWRLPVSVACRWPRPFAAWLSDADGYYLNRTVVPPGNGWDVVNDALRAAAVYE